MSEYREKFERDGYVRIHKFFSAEEVRRMREEVTTAPTGLAVSTLNRQGMIFREHMLDSSVYLREMVTSPRVIELMTGILGPDLWIRRDTGIIKNAGGVEFGWHQDNGYNQLLDGYAQFWVAITPMNDANGGLWLIPGSHKNGLQPHHMVQTHFVWTGKPVGQIPVEAEAGDVVVFSSYLVHRTGPNKTDQPRIAYLVEYMNQEYFDPYTKAPFFLVSRDGKPAPRKAYFYKGNTSISNQLKYVWPRTNRRQQIIRGQVRRALSRAFPAVFKPR
jgi:ectoine hydroxylase-related dioxygenase (phytanoyl-CoA dioxygenase family)